MQINNPKDDVQDYFKVVGDFRSSGKRSTSMLLRGKDGEANNYKLSLSKPGQKEAWMAPRHRHTFEQFRHPISGDYVIHKDEVLPAGWCAYFPESAYYGPQVKSGNLQMISLQFGGPSGLGYWGMEQCKEAFDRLVAKGRVFEEGFCTWIDEDGKRHNQDASEAVEAEARGHAVDYPERRYQDVIIMNPDAFSWVKDDAANGVAHKTLGSFTERDARIGFVQMEKGAALPFGNEKSPEILFLKEGKVSYDNRTFDKHTAFGTEKEEAPVTLSAIEPSEFLYLKLPNF